MGEVVPVVRRKIYTVGMRKFSGIAEGGPDE